MSEPPLVQEIRQGAMWIRLNRPEAMNSLTPQLLAGLSAALDEAQARDEVKAIVLTGAGPAFMRCIHCAIWPAGARVLPRPSKASMCRSAARSVSRGH